jgi:hypothetical protein
MHIGPTLMAHAQSSKLVQPGEGTLDPPPCQTEMAAMLGEALAELRPDAAPSQDRSIRFPAVAAVSLQAPQFAQRSPAPAGRPSSKGMSWVESWRFAPVRITFSGVPPASTRR